MLRVLDTVLYKFAQQWTCVKEILEPWQGPCPPHLYLCPLSWLALIVRLWNISHTFFLCSLCQPLSSAKALVGQRRDTRLANGTEFPWKFWYFDWIYVCCCLEGQCIKIWPGTPTTCADPGPPLQGERETLCTDNARQCMAGNHGASQCILTGLKNPHSKHKETERHTSKCKKAKVKKTKHK